MSTRIQDKYEINLLELESLVDNISDFYELTAADQIKYFVYFLSIESKKKVVKPIQVEKCFELMHLAKYSNISSYLSRGSRGRNKKFIKKNKGYVLERTKRNEIKEELNKLSKPKPTNNLFPLSLVENTRGYIQEIAHQSVICYDYRIYDASFVMIRKLIETLIIECFEKFRLEDKIKNKSGDYFYLSDLINKILKEDSWKIGREVGKSLKKIKRLADQSAHNRRFVAQKEDMESLKTDIRLTIQELINLIDYQDWNHKLSNS